MKLRAVNVYVDLLKGQLPHLYTSQCVGESYCIRQTRSMNYVVAPEEAVVMSLSGSVPCG